MTDWSAPQWTMAVFLFLSLVLPPIVFSIAKFQGKQVGTWPVLIRARVADALEKTFVLAVLIWGGFF